MKYIYYALLMLGVIILIIKWEKIDKKLHLFLPIYILTLFTEAIADITKAYFVYHIHQTISFLLLCVYYSLLMKEKLTSWLVWVSFMAYAVFVISYFMRHRSNFFSFDPIDFVAEAVLITLFSLYYLIYLYKNNEGIVFNQYPHFWIVVGNLLFYPGSAFFMGFASTLALTNKAIYVQLSYIVYILNLLLYSVYIKALLCRLQQNKQG